MQLDRDTTEDWISLRWSTAEFYVWLVVSFFLFQVYGPKDVLVTNVIFTPDVTEDIMLSRLNAVTLIFLVMGVMCEMWLWKRTFWDKPNQVVNHMYSNAPTVEQNINEIQRELDLLESINDLDHAAIGFEAVKQLCIQLSNEKQDLAHKLCLLPWSWYAMYYCVVHLFSIIPVCHVLFVGFGMMRFLLLG